MQIYFGLENTRPVPLNELAKLLNTSERTAADAVQICCPARPGEVGVHRLLTGDSDRLRAYCQKHGKKAWNPAQRAFVDADIKGRVFTR